jgi:polyphosphate kinase
MQNRELSWLHFNERVLEEANRADNPLFERLSFLSIFTTNLDEFFMVRVGSLMDYMRHDPGYTDNKSGMNAEEQLEKIYKAVTRLYANRDDSFTRLERELDLEIMKRAYPGLLDETEKKALKDYFDAQIRPVLSPQIVDASHPFPHIENKKLIIGILLENKEKHVFGMIPLPSDAERLYLFRNGNAYILLEDIILEYCGSIFTRHTIAEKAAFRITRNADIGTIRDIMDETEDFREHMSRLLKKRRRLEPVRLEVRGGSCAKLLAYLQKQLSLEASQTFFTLAPIDLSYCDLLSGLTEPGHLRRLSFLPFEPVHKTDSEQNGSVIRRLRHGDLLLSHPYESIQPFLSLIKEASEDRNVSSIRITLYRIAEQSKLVEYLTTAAESGKEVFVFIELRARMDEENNIEWAKRMEDAGCHIFYGPSEFKLHAKVCLIIRRELGINEFITHIGTGNYNEKTSRIYTDISLLTVNNAIGHDVVRFFQNMMTGAVHDNYHLLWVAPQTFKTRLIDQLHEEMKYADSGRVTIKCNSLTDKDVIAELVSASRAGVKIQLIIRGICCLIPQIPGLTENIRIVSVVGRFLEHSRIYRFGSGARTRIFIGSGDMMTRNTTRRIELFAPVLEKKQSQKLSDLLDIALRDNVKARELMAGGQYACVYRAPEDAPADSQLFFMEQAKNGGIAAAEHKQPKRGWLAALRAKLGGWGAS